VFNLLLPILVLMLIAWIWLDAARAREFATVLARRHCERRGLQFLDETVALVRVGLRWTNEGLRVRRMYRFDFSLEGTGRRFGFILMIGSRLEAVEDGLPRPSPQPEKDITPVVSMEKGPDDDPPDRGNVVPFKKPKS
jgi:hypothetical protein